eukprot:g2429.t1
MSSNLTTNITNATLYGGKIGKCFYQIPDEGLTFGVLCVAYTINRVVLSKELKMNKRAAAIIRKRVEKPALFGIYVLQFIIALVTVLPSTTGPYYLYCSVQTAILTVHASFVIASSIRRLANSRFATYADLVTTNKGNLGFPATEFLLAGVGTAAYIFIGIMDDQFRDVSFWRFVFRTKTEEQRQKDLASAAATDSTRNTKASSDGSV